MDYGGVGGGNSCGANGPFGPSTQSSGRGLGAASLVGEATGPPFSAGWQQQGPGVKIQLPGPSVKWHRNWKGLRKSPCWAGEVSPMLREARHQSRSTQLMHAGMVPKDVRSEKQLLGRPIPKYTGHKTGMCREAHLSKNVLIFYKACLSFLFDTLARYKITDPQIH